ncbi:MAG: hypothetical protein ACE5Z5_06220 [Candidatus Bathyarchaeia archaeon]
MSLKLRGKWGGSGLCGLKEENEVVQRLMMLGSALCEKTMGKGIGGRAD